MKIAVQTGGVMEFFGLEEGFRIIHEAGFDAVDFNIDHCMSGSNIVKGICESKMDLPLEEILKKAQECKDIADKYGVSFYQAHAPFPSYVREKDEMNDYLIDVFNKCIAVCGTIGCKYLIIHPMFCSYDEKLDPEEEWEINIARYSALIPALKKYGVIACLENMFTVRRGKVYEAICSDMNEAAAYIDELNGIAGEKCFAFCLDTGHALLVGKDIYSALMQIGDRVEAFHIHDNDGVNDLHMAPYTGKLDWDRFIKGVKDIGFKGTLSFETFNMCCSYDKELIPDVLKLIAATGKMFARRIEE